MKLFLKWRPSAILNFRKLLIWSLDLCLNMIVLLRTKFHVNRTINRRTTTSNPSGTTDFVFTKLPRALAKDRKMATCLAYFSVTYLATSIKLAKFSLAERTAYNTISTSCQIFKSIGLVVSVSFLMYMEFHVSSFWLEIAILGQILTFGGK